MHFFNQKRPDVTNIKKAKKIQIQHLNSNEEKETFNMKTAKKL